MFRLQVVFLVDWTFFLIHMICKGFCGAPCILVYTNAFLILFYLIQKYVQTLIRAAKSPARRLAALKCMGALLDAASHFNYRDSMLKAMVPRMMSFDDEIRLVSILITFEVIRMMSQLQIL
jgi:hypothetical protein